MLLALVLAEPVANPIRFHHSRIVKAMEEGSRRSATFKGLIERLTQSDLIIYVESGRCSGPQVMSSVAVTPSPSSYRYVRVTVDTDHSLLVLISEIAHELEHAIEIAGAPEVVDRQTLRGFYDRIGFSSASLDAYETAEAIAIAARVRLELIAPLRTQDPSSTDGPNMKRPHRVGTHQARR